MMDKTCRRILWKKTEKNSAKILRIFGDSPHITIPSQIAGYPVTELGDYCFAPDCCLPADGCLTEYSGPVPYEENMNLLTELSGNYIECIILPDSLHKIGDYTFYNCRKLSCISFGHQLTVIGSDAFMNCRRLENLHIRCAPLQSSGLRQILSQISWDVEVSFYKNEHNENSFYSSSDINIDICNFKDHQIQAAVFFPEYYESYEEIAPAHVFGRSITGEGFRARHSFKNGVIDFAQYDTIFQKACAEESEQTVCRIAFNRLRYPIGLSNEKQKLYQSYLKTHGMVLCRWLVSNKQLDALHFLFEQKLLSRKDAQYAVKLALDAEWTKGSASMIRWNKTIEPASMHTNYEFEDF